MMIEAAYTTERIRRAYDCWSLIYNTVAAPLEHGPRKLALNLAAIQPTDKVLEVAVGGGTVLLEIAKRVDRENIVCGVDLSMKMLAKARRLVNAAGYAQICLQQSEATQLPFAAGRFDVVYCSYLLDLLPLKVIPIAVEEFKRVLKPGGRLILVNLSKPELDELTWIERIYQGLPKAWVPYLLGSCRPVFMEGFVKEAGFNEIRRLFLSNITCSEIVTAKKPSE